MHYDDKRHYARVKARRWRRVLRQDSKWFWGEERGKELGRNRGREVGEQVRNKGRKWVKVGEG